MPFSADTEDIARQDALFGPKPQSDLDSDTSERAAEDLARQDAIMGTAPSAVQSDTANINEQLEVTRQDEITRQKNLQTAVAGLTSSSMILSARGAFYRVPLQDKAAPGVYAIDELNRFIFTEEDLDDPFLQDTAFSKKQPSPILILGVRFNQTDITSQVPCLNNNKVFYSFGQNFGQVVINGEILLGPMGDISKDGVDRLLDFFWKHRVSVSLNPIAVSASENTYYMYLTGLTMMEVNVDFHILPFVLFGTLLDLGRDASANLNPKSQVLTEGGIDNSSLFQALSVRQNGGPDVSAAVTAPKDLSPLNDEKLKDQREKDAQAVIDSKSENGAPLTPEMILLRQQIVAEEHGDSVDNVLSYNQKRYKELMDTEQNLNETDPEAADKFRTDNANIKAVYGQRVLNEYSSFPQSSKIDNNPKLDELSGQASQSGNVNRVDTATSPGAALDQKQKFLEEQKRLNDLQPRLENSRRIISDKEAKEHPVKVVPETKVPDEEVLNNYFKTAWP